MSESANGTPASELNDAQKVARLAQASQITAEAPAPKATAPKRASAATRKANAAKVPAKKPTAAKAAKPKLVAVAVELGPSNLQKRAAANELAKAAAKLLAGWSGAMEKRTGCPKEYAATVIAASLNYAPVSEWPAGLPERSGAGGRGSKTRKAS